jgi:hypothetical protein
MRAARARLSTFFMPRGSLVSRTSKSEGHEQNKIPAPLSI